MTLVSSCSNGFLRLPRRRVGSHTHNIFRHHIPSPRTTRASSTLCIRRPVAPTPSTLCHWSPSIPTAPYQQSRPTTSQEHRGPLCPAAPTSPQSLRYCPRTIPIGNSSDTDLRVCSYCPMSQRAPSPWMAHIVRPARSGHESAPTALYIRFNCDLCPRRGRRGSTLAALA